MSSPKFVAIGEAMLEFGRNTDTSLVANGLENSINGVAENYKLSFAGDTYNTLFYFQQYAHLSQACSYFATAVGDDVMSAKMLARWQQESINTSLVAVIPGKAPGLYIIVLDDIGERKFIYYRSHSAARDYCSSDSFPGFSSEISKMEYIYFSGITLAIYSPDNLDKLFVLLEQAKQNGAQIVFDTNYRPSLWQNKSYAQQVISRFYSLVSIALPTFEDDQNLFADDSVDATIARLRAHGISEIVVKCGADGCVVFDGGDNVTLPVPEKINVVDTTAAGDSFNGSYLAMRVAGRSPGEAASRAHQVAAKVIQSYGALVSLDLPDFN